MRVELGNEAPIEGYRDPESDDPELVRYRRVEGKRITSIDIPTGKSLGDAFRLVTGLVPYHFAKNSNPVWVESDSPGLTALLAEHYGLDPENAGRPADWKKE